MESIRDNTIEKATTICKKEIEELFKIWDETGIRNEILNTYADQILNHLIGLMKDMVDESLEKKRDLLKNVKSLVQSARKISKELGIHFETNSYDDLPLIELEVNLKKQVEQLQHIKKQRLEYIQELVTKESEICKKMGLKSVGFGSEIPTEQEIKEFEDYLNMQEMEKNRLSETFKDTRRSIIKLMEELDISPALDFEKMVCHDYNNFIYSASNMNKVRDLKERLKDQVEQAKSQVQEKRNTLIALWDYLDEPLEVRQAFFEAYPGYTLNTLNAYNNEIKRCKEKRSENVANYVNKIRGEIENLWELCKYSELQKKSFAAIKCQTYTEDLLTLHEMEAENLRKFYNSNKKIFELLNKWEDQFEKLKELDRRANDPDRYHNRGGQLLMEEKERNAAEKKLPKLENQLFALVDEYESKSKTTFSVNGYSLKEYMIHFREVYECEKENMKLERKQAKDRSAKKTPLSISKRTPYASNTLRTPASSTLRTPASNTLRTPSNNTLRTPGVNNLSRRTPLAKRKLPYDTSINTSDNKKRALCNKKLKNTVLCNKVRRSGRLHGETILNGSGHIKASKKKRKSISDTTLSVSSYGQFQEHIDNRDELRSSILPEQALKKASERTPMKTPIKPVRRKVIASTPTVANSTRMLRGTPRLVTTHRLIQVKNSSPTDI